MRILVVTEFFYPRLVGGGEIVLWNICNSLAKRGHEIYVVTSKVEGSPEFEVVNSIKIYRPFFSFDTCENSLSIRSIIKRLFFGIKLYKYLLKFLDKHQVDIIYCLGYPTILPSTWVGHKKGIPCVVSIEYFPNNIFETLAMWTILQLSRADVLRCPSINVSKKIQKLSKKNVHVVPNPINDAIIREVMNIDAKEVRQKLDIGEEQFLLYVGRLISIKNVDGLIKAVSRLTIPFKLVIVGDGPERKRLEELVDELNLNGKVVFLGQKSYTETLKIMKACDVVILPSKSEVFPMVVIEALALNKPVISTPVGGVVEINSPNLVIVNDPEEIMDELISKIKSVEDKTILELYSLDNISNQFEKLFQELIDANKSKN